MEMDRARYEASTRPMQTHINVGCGKDVTIRELAELIAKVTGFKGRIEFDSTKPDGSPRKLLDVSLLTGLGWKPTMDLERGLTVTYADFEKSPRTR
jgi:GDP-L-fucose synthase